MVVYMNVSIHVYTHIYICVHIYTYIHRHPVNFFLHISVMLRNFLLPFRTFTIFKKFLFIGV